MSLHIRINVMKILKLLGGDINYSKVTSARGLQTRYHFAVDLFPFGVAPFSLTRPLISDRRSPAWILRFPGEFFLGFRSDEEKH